MCVCVRFTALSALHPAERQSVQVEGGAVGGLGVVRICGMRIAWEREMHVECKSVAYIIGG